MATSRKRNVEIDVVVDDKKARAGLAGVDQSAGRLEGTFGKIKGAFAGFLGVLGARELGQFAVDAAQMAATAEIAGKSAEKVLGPALEGLHDNLEETRQVLGLNSGELDQIVARFGLLSEGFGLSDEKQAAFVENLIRTGGELAAFRGNIGEAPEAIDALGAALRGEFDPLEQFGVKLSVAAINERKLELAADPANKKLSDQELQIAALESLIREKAGPAFGSLAEAQDTLAGKTNIATTRLEDMQAKLGKKLIPVFEELAETAVKTFDDLEEEGDQSFLDEVLGDYAAWGEAAHALFQNLGLIEKELPEITSATADLSVEMDKARHATRDHGDELEETAEEAEGLAAATEDATTALDHFEDEIRGQIDPMFALSAAVKDVEKAQKATTEAAKEHGRKSPEYQEAVQQEAQKWLDLKEAQLRVAEQSRFTREQFETHLRNMTGLTEEQVDLIIAEFERINAFKFTVPTIRGRDVSAGGSDADRTFRGGRARGGSVRQGGTYLVGEEGPELLHMGSGSGTVIPNDKIGGTQVIQLVVDGRVLAEAVRRADRRWTP